MSLILIAFSLDLCIDTVRRNLMLVTLGALRIEGCPLQNRFDCSTTVFALHEDILITIYHITVDPC